MSGLIIPGGGGLAVPPEIVIERLQKKLADAIEANRELARANEFLRRRLAERTGQSAGVATLSRQDRRRAARMARKPRSPEAPK